MSALSATASAVAPTTTLRAVAAATIGNALEWFDLVVYGFFAPVMADLFFPGKDPHVGLLYAFGTFGISFVVRPVGAVLVGRFADRSGRRAALVLVSGLMMLGTLMIAVMPPYSRIGVAAPALLLIARLVQGFSAGGEFGSATAYLAEQSPRHRGFYASLQFASQGLSTLLASLLGLILTTTLSSEQLHDWGWRVPFVLGLAIGPVAWFIRSHAPETPEFEALRAGKSGEARAGRPARTVSKVIAGTAAVIVGTVSMYLMLYTPTFATTVLELNVAVGFAATLAMGVTLLVLPPVMGAWSDRIGRLPLALPTAALLVVLPIPLFLWLVDGPSGLKVVLIQTALGLVTATYLGVLAPLLAELFPVDFRTTGLSLCYNLAVVAAGGFAPLAVTALVKLTGSHAAPGFYLAAAAAVSLPALIVVKAQRWVR
jgi:MHS family proline/betaine transporter-like MFS transporter